MMEKGEAIKELYKKAYGNTTYEEYGGFIVYPNMKEATSHLNPSPPFPDAATICFTDECEDLKQSIRDEITGLGFSLEDVDHQIPINGTLHDRRCYVKWSGQHFTTSDLYIDRIKDLAVGMGYTIKDVSDKPHYWGFYGSTLDDAYNDLDEFVNEVGLRMHSADASEQDGGYVYYVKSWYLHGMYALFERWKTVSEPYWEGNKVKVDCVAQNLLADKRYYARGYCGNELVSSDELRDGDHTAPERSCTLVFTETAINSWCSPLPFDIEVVLTENWTEKDRVTRTIPEKPTPTPTPTPTPVGDITRVELDGELLPENGTLRWTVNEEASVKVYFKNVGNAAGEFRIEVAYNGDTICDLETDSVPADGREYYVDDCVFTPDETGTHEIKVTITP